MSISSRPVDVRGQRPDLSAQGDGEPREVGPGGLRMILEPKGVPHAWKALEDTTCLVFTKGPRSGDQYESDTYRLEEPLLA
jgi:quercetin dioxygenase-like cupin family protein